MPARRLKLAVWKFASCDGCQLSLLDLDEELLDLAQTVEIARFHEATRAVDPGPYHLSIVEGSITTAEEVERIRRVRAASRVLIPIGVCATAGGIQALRNFGEGRALAARVYPRPEQISALPTSSPVSAYVQVDFELQGCPPNRHQVLDAIKAVLSGRRAVAPRHSVCVECKQRGNVCVMVTGTPCMGPVTQAGCGALCPSYDRGCYSCFGPMETPNTGSLAGAFRRAGYSEGDLLRTFRFFYANADAFRKEAAEHEH